MLQQPEVAWVVAPTLDLGQPFASLGETVRTSALLGPEAEQQLLNTAHVTWQHSSRRARGAKNSADRSTAATVQRSAQLALANNVVPLHKTLDTFVQQKFVVDDGALKEPLARPAPQARIAWNPAVLAEAVELAGRYDTFVKTTLTGARRHGTDDHPAGPAASRRQHERA